MKPTKPAHPKTRRYGYEECPRCAQPIHTKSMELHQSGALCTTRWFAKRFPTSMVPPMGADSKSLQGRLAFDGKNAGIRTTAVLVEGKAKVAPAWVYALVKSLPRELVEDAVKRCLEDPTFAKAVDTLAITTINAYTLESKEILELFESRAERARRIARDRAERNEKQVRSELRSLEKERDKLELKIKDLRKRAKYYDHRRAKGQAVYAEEDVEAIRREVWGDDHASAH